MIPERPARIMPISPQEPAGRHDELGELIRRNADGQQELIRRNARATQKHAQAKPAQKAYGASDRRALDKLVEATGTGGNSKP